MKIQLFQIHIHFADDSYNERKLCYDFGSHRCSECTLVTKSIFSVNAVLLLILSGGMGNNRKLYGGRKSIQTI